MFQSLSRELSSTPRWPRSIKWRCLGAVTAILDDFTANNTMPRTYLRLSTLLFGVLRLRVGALASVPCRACVIFPSIAIAGRVPPLFKFIEEQDGSKKGAALKYRCNRSG
ncbi:hypothetical protein NDU88_005634 [Pleurodeles waltl]|uniref:Uncharacterized protein n=1 Tax=Pleurodeles waltl TaxID=8319 RepID=A0AAV7PG98_PLEWA|nr:hypothetical protein NDU88_005634 [Pleurodeles waltl]